MSEVMNIESQFADALTAAGFTAPDIVADGKIHRFDGPEDKRNKKSAWYVLHVDGDMAGGALGDWKTGMRSYWSSRSENTLTPEQRAAWRAHMDRIRAEVKAEKQRQQKRAAAKARKIWAGARDATADNPYCQKKKVKPYGLKEFHDRRTLIVPVRNSARELVSLQFIYEDGSKRFLTGGEKAGCSYLFGRSSNERILIAEGFATAASLHEATGMPVAVSFDCGNLASVARQLRNKLPECELILCADDDAGTAGNPGWTKARAAARSVGGLLAIPAFGPDRPNGATDFNDLHALGGLEAVRACIEAATPPGDEQEATALPEAEKAATAPRKRSGPSVVLTRACDIVPEPIYWLWPGYLPAGKFTAFAGPAGCGKTTIAIALAATVSNGGAWPDGTQCPEPGNVVIWTGEDGLADTLVPRLMAAGADLTRVRFIESVIDDDDKLAPFDPSRDVPILSEKLTEIGGARLLIVDPIISAVRGDSHKAGDVRISLQPLLDLAAAHNCALLGITHFSKGSKGAATNDRLIGSQAFGASARVILIAGKDETSGRRVFMKSKANITDDAGGFEYSIDVLDIGDLASSRVQWGEPLTGSAGDILREIEADEDSQEDAAEQASKFDRARSMIYELLRPFASTRELKAAAAAEGISWRTVEAAKKTELASGAKIRAVRQGKDWGWIWDTHGANYPDEVKPATVYYADFGNNEGQLTAVDDATNADSTPQPSTPQSIQVRKDDCGVENQAQQGIQAKSATPQSISNAPRAHACAHTRTRGGSENHCGLADLTGNTRPARDSSPQSSPQSENHCGLESKDCGLDDGHVGGDL
ncbi:AAA family ATPase [Paraburkholderia sp. MM6662-R1]|uniref:AAA family ATPase n=1 Tax=Paraburkholderia sp. MM6662-R1 TaxID=2991066 RepID=UPI003D2153E6